MMTERLAYANTPTARIDWGKRVRAYLDALPESEWTPLQDWQLMSAAFAGQKIEPLPDLPEMIGARTARFMTLQNAIRDDGGTLTLDGRAALMVALRERAGAP